MAVGARFLTLSANQCQRVAGEAHPGAMAADLPNPSWDSWALLADLFPASSRGSCRPSICPSSNPDLPSSAPLLERSADPRNAQKKGHFLVCAALVSRSCRPLVSSRFGTSLRVGWTPSRTLPRAVWRAGKRRAEPRMWVLQDPRTL